MSRRGGIDDVIKLLDFGLVQQSSEDEGAGIAGGPIAGTPHFMSPEQATGREVTQRSDLYSLGATAYFLLTGRPLFPDRRAREVIAAHIDTPVTPPSELSSGMPADLEGVILKCLQKDPVDRFQTAAELEQALSECQSADRWTQQDALSWWRNNKTIG